MGTNVGYEIDNYNEAVMLETLRVYYSNKRYACSNKNENPNIFWMDSEYPEASEVIENYNKQLVIYNNTQYQRDRQYPTWQEQMDMQYHDEIDGTTTWKDAVAKVKSDNPKPE